MRSFRSIWRATCALATLIVAYAIAFVRDFAPVVLPRFDSWGGLTVQTGNPLDAGLLNGLRHEAGMKRMAAARSV